jgi:hypothetical protein
MYEKIIYKIPLIIVVRSLTSEVVTIEVQSLYIIKLNIYTKFVLNLYYFAI